MKVKSPLLLGLAAGVCLLALHDRSNAQSAASSGDDEADRVRIGFQIAPVPLALHHQEPALVGLGSYIVNSHGWCNECHSVQEWADGHDPTNGEPAKVNVPTYLSGGVSFGAVSSSNITPDAHGLPAGLTFPQFVHAMRSGLDPGNGHPQVSPFMQVMPWPYIRNQTPRDLAAIYAYLRAIPSLPNPPAAAAGRRIVWTSHSSAQEAATSGDDADRIRVGFQVAPVPLKLRGKDPDLVGLGSYLVNTRTFCNQCHTTPAWADGHNPFLGQFPPKANAAAYLAGGRAFGPFISRNLTPDARGLPAGLTFTQFVQVMRTGVDPDKVHPNISPLLQVMPWPYFKNMSLHDLAAIYEYLSAIPSLPSASGTPP